MSNDLLPSNATSTERKLSLVGSRMLSIPIPVSDVWSPWKAPEQVLPWLAWALSVDNWDKNWSVEQKRAVIADAPISQKIKGTIGAVESNLIALGVTIRIQEWFNQIPEGEPYTYILWLDVKDDVLDKAKIDRILDIIATKKNLRSHMQTVRISAKAENQAYAVANFRTGHLIHMTGFHSPTVFANEFNLANNNTTAPQGE